MIKFTYLKDVLNLEREERKQTQDKYTYQNIHKALVHTQKLAISRSDTNIVERNKLMYYNNIIYINLTQK